MIRLKKGGDHGQGEVIHAQVIGGAPVEVGAEVIGAEDCAQLLFGAQYGVGLPGAGVGRRATRGVFTSRHLCR